MRMIRIREETPADYGAIDRVNQLAFGGTEEVDLVRHLRNDGDVLVSLVADMDLQVIGHVLMSRMAIETAREQIPAVALAPMAVHPDFQKRGIGSALAEEAIELCRLRDELIVLVMGHPEYYPRFGFSAERAEHLAIPFELLKPGAFMALELKLGALEYTKGRVRYAKAFGLGSEWTVMP